VRDPLRAWGEEGVGEEEILERLARGRCTQMKVKEGFRELLKSLELRWRAG
jgi:hypothetical protein